MARLYEWEAHLTPKEAARLERSGPLLESAKREAARLQSERDAIRRKAVQRARNALNKRLRAEHKEKSNAHS